MALLVSISAGALQSIPDIKKTSGNQQLTTLAPQMSLNLMPQMHQQKIQQGRLQQGQQLKQQQAVA